MRYGIWCVRSGLSIFGRAESWMKDSGGILTFETAEQAGAYIAKLKHSPASVTYEVMPYE